MNGASKRMRRALNVKIFTFKTAVNMFECIEISETIYEGVVEPSCKKLLKQMLKVPITACK